MRSSLARRLLSLAAASSCAAPPAHLLPQAKPAVTSTPLYLRSLMATVAAPTVAAPTAGADARQVRVCFERGGLRLWGGGRGDGPPPGSR